MRECPRRRSDRYGHSRPYWLVVVLALACLAVVDDALAQWTTVGLNFRGSSGYVTDSTGEAYVLAETSSTTRTITGTGNSVTFQWTGSVSAANRDSGNDRRLAGINYVDNSAGVPASLDVTLPNSGNHTICVALGDAASSQGYQLAEILDNTTSKFSVTGLTTDNHFRDAFSTDFTAAAWPAGNVCKTGISFTSGHLVMKLGATSSQTNASTIAHLYIAYEGADPTPTPSPSPTVSPSPSPTPTTLTQDICGNGWDDMSSGHTFGACPAGEMNAVWQGSGCDVKCPAPDQDRDGDTTDGSGMWLYGTATVNGAQASVNTITVNAGHKFYRDMRATFFDSIAAGNVTRNVIGYDDTSITVDGAAVTVANGASIDAATRIDCDDTNRLITVGIYKSCGTDGTQVCQASGSYSGCIEGELCEATGGGSCYYIDPTKANNSASGTSRANAWRDPAKITYYGSAGLQPSGWIDIACGSVVYLMGGNHTVFYESELDTTHTRFLKFRTKNCGATTPILVKGYPGTSPIIVGDSTLDLAIEVQQSTNVRVIGNDKGIRFNGGNNQIGPCYQSDESNDSTIRNVLCRDITGHTDNLGGIKISSSERYQAVNNMALAVVGNDPDGQGDAMFLYFRGGGLTAFNGSSSSLVGYTSGGTLCYKKKHANCGKKDLYWGNDAWNCGEAGFDNAGETFGYHNRVINSGRVGFHNIGGPARQKFDWRWNTQKQTREMALYVVPQEDWNNDGTTTPAADECSGTCDLGEMRYENNEVEVLSADNIFDYGTYAPDLFYDIIFPASPSDWLLKVSNNIVNNANGINYCIMCNNVYTMACAPTNVKGETKSFAQMQSFGLESSSSTAAISWNTYDSSGTSRGWLATDNLTPPVGGGGGGASTSGGMCLMRVGR